ncbi:Proline and alanine rich protein EspI, component of Type VII secretion system ESX-1 [Pseudonocardia sp. Ae168_Ps1]|nr:Proline and alanine rich protein EspI, component of Type VII secretion system ESX-1 [Pseudonocardia sp. Ae150A_Ps1]OLL80257.1 Proline and alanine rich protein EspI, component of Type VII secretion system ESX-1 [Pseudonocardia sp. Ae168_Ps1]OLL85616.1 Proline and alanine rich protein EspI, component of Type VII secretion system ESX-1 [Pseudonocardia sp. Ae263_Ps1]OLL94356.1 Proline and alanine rich protein EspI, component of Type VII secretion system ESX-1 [Pseudonocardia sp. Ae356_Ps1]
MSENGSGEQPDGSVGRYVRERWGAADNAGRSFGRRRRTGGDDAAQPDAGPARSSGAAEQRPPSAAERAASAPAPGRAGVGTRTPLSGSAWGSELPDVDDDLVDEIDPSTPPHGLDLSALHRASPDAAEDPAPGTSPGPGEADGSGDDAAGGDRHDDGRHRAADPVAASETDHGPDDTGLYRTGGGDPEPWWAVPAPAARDDSDDEVIWRRPDAPAARDEAAEPGAADPVTGQAPAGTRAPDPATDEAPAPRQEAAPSRDTDPAAGASSREPARGSAPAAEQVPAAAAEPDRRPSRAGDGPAARPGERPRGEDPARSDSVARPAVERPWRASWDRDAAERDATDRGSREEPRRPRWTPPEAVEARAAQHRRGSEPHGGLDLAPSRGAHGARRAPASGWRRLVYVLTRGLVNPGESPAEIHRRELVSRLNRPLISSHKIAMLSLKGGVGKTTVTATLGATFASHRGDRVVAVDANPDRGTLSQKIPLETTATVRHLLRDSDKVRRYSDVRAYTSQGVSRLEVLASEQDPAVSEAFSEDDYRRAVDLLEHFYNLVLTDCGTGLMHSAMYGVLGMADQLVIVSSGSIDGARSASATLDWLDAHGYGPLVRNAVVVINTVYRRAGGGVDLDRVAEHFAGRCRAVVRVPFDPHLEEGAEIDLDSLEEPTRTALLELAAAVADGFPV